MYVHDEEGLLFLVTSYFWTGDLILDGDVREIPGI